jgi:hypothetical protein
MVSLADRATLVAATGATASLQRNPNPPLQIDASLDADIVFHEFGHGLTWRTIGGMSGAISGAIGEGSGDTLAFLINGDDRIAEYSYSADGGIRRYPYQNYPLTYGAVDGGEVHNDGEIYAAAMWRVYQNYLAAGFTNQEVLTDWIGGMNLTASQPSYEAMRDGMVLAAGARGCLVWRGFAATGIGVGSAISGRKRLTVTESFAVPAQCQ